MIKKRLKKGILAIVLAITAVFCASCASDDAMDQILSDYPIRVTIDFNGGKRSDQDYYRVQVKENSLLGEPQETQSVYKPPQLAGYKIEGYYLGTKDANGNVTFGEKWDFSSDRVTEEITLYVKWQKKLSLVIRYVGEDLPTVADKVSDLTASFSPSEWKYVVMYDCKGYTFDKFYEDESCTTAITSSVDCSSMDSDYVVYAKFNKNA